jgi:aldehyde:ferredoxin oxidoreductase
MTQNADYAQWYDQARTIAAEAIHDELVACNHKSFGWDCKELAKAVLAALGENGFLQYAVYRYPKERLGAQFDGSGS